MQEHDAYFAFHLFAARFADDAEAERFAFEQWEPAPAADASDAEFSAWESRNPSWRLNQELGFYMDSDFVELCTCVDYLDSLVRSEAQKALLRSQATKAFSHFILVGSQSIYGDKRSATSGPNQRQPENTATLDYLGEFNG